MTLDVIDKKALKIMLVDDDDISSFIYRKIIEKAGLTQDHISTFLKGQDGIAHLENTIDNTAEFPDLILLDINMPVMDGWGFLDEYAEKVWPNLNKRVVVCMLSSSVYQEDINKAYGYAQVNDYVSKPLTSGVLEDLINKHFGES
ncbi:response regulator [Fulvivirga lutimaris]|uniref:response regulator n=1 Tax=Fulvivirga lutimaris TaxID=1819566 RepID=UPI0012BC30AA|nr:response regulator [Fulvivirga lutimaris]MTI39005.1 response regulator [Fulvivirga lutimaris]